MIGCLGHDAFSGFFDFEVGSSPQPEPFTDELWKNQGSSTISPGEENASIRGRSDDVGFCVG
jgi:hypothetical protein